MKIFKFAGILLFFALFLCLLLVGLVIVTSLLNNSADGIAVDGVLFKVTPGESGENVIGRLEDQKLIRSSLLMRIIAKINGTEGSFKAGLYRITPGLTTVDIHNLLVSGKEEMEKITFVEGWTLSKIALHLEAKNFSSAKEFIAVTSSPDFLKEYNIPAKTAEGYLFPDTYYFPAEISSREIAAKMIETFFEKIREYSYADKPLTPAELHKKLILASIVEREYRREDEAPVIASVFANRLARNQKLESCATIAYIISEIYKRPYPKRIYSMDLKLPSLYNTYIHYGLPPGPISNPGLTAIVSTLSPANTTYLYFVLKDPEKGIHEFSDTFSQHMAFKEQYIKSE
ncbi:MAG: endolytic transglycosylase MltG [Spirochaetaceae bacterium]|nr:MAG: endolytic transglycosylase MltG [Spirochaetaceae bacterium]